jgi:hypothetical protein
MIKNIISKATAGILIFFFWLIAGILVSPFWLIIVIFGALLQAFEWKKVPKMWWDLIMIKWFFD